MKEEQDIFEFRIRGFYASESPADCVKFVAGHRQVLIDHGFEHITSNNADWVTSDDIYVMLAESLDGSEVYGGIRVHPKKTGSLLELEKALVPIDPGVEDYIRQYMNDGIAEICGLWNAKSVAGYRISYLLTRCGLGVVTAMNFDYALAFLARYTLYIVRNLKFELITEIGNEGVFHYPNELFVAGVYQHRILNKLENLDEADREAIIYMNSLSKEPVHEISKWNKHFLVHYDVRV